MDKITKHERELENERTRIMDLMVREHVQSMEDQSEPGEQIESMNRLTSLEERYKQILQQLQELAKCRDVLENSRIREESDSQAVKDFCLQLESLITDHCDDFSQSTVSIPIESVDDLEDSIEFTAEEEHGKYLDLHECHQHYMKLEYTVEVDYITYVATFDHLFDIPREKKNAEYCQYINALFNYLHGYLARVQPLYDMRDGMKKAEIEFETRWQSGTFPGWQQDAEDDSQRGKATNSQPTAFTSWSELKSSLAELRLETEGPTAPNGQKVSDTRGDDRVLLTPSDRNEITENCRANDIAKYKKVATLEAMVYHLLDLISIQRVATLKKVQQKKGRTVGEYVDSDCGIYANGCAKELLHDQNVSYNCQICGNYRYNGPEAFQRHFFEWRHTYKMHSGMKSNPTRVLDPI